MLCFFILAGGDQLNNWSKIRAWMCNWESSSHWNIQFSPGRRRCTGTRGARGLMWVTRLTKKNKKNKSHSGDLTVIPESIYHNRIRCPIISHLKGNVLIQFGCFCHRRSHLIRTKQIRKWETATGDGRDSEGQSKCEDAGWRSTAASAGAWDRHALENIHYRSDP